MNTIHPTIKLEMSYYMDKIPCLDTTVILTINGNIETTLYKTPVDVSFLLHAHYFTLPTAKQELSTVWRLDIAESSLITMNSKNNLKF